MKFGLKPAQFEVLDRLVFQPLKNRNAVVYVFGSRARGTHHPFSDIDLLYVENPSSPIAGSEISNILEEVENSNLPFKVDLVNQANLAASYREGVEKEKVLV